MASLIARRAFATSARRFATSAETTLNKETKRNPELVVRHAYRPAERSPTVVVLS